MVFDKLQSINRKTAAVCVAALLTGFIAGAGYAWSSNKTSPHYNAVKLTGELHYAKVETGRLQCVVLQDKAADGLRFPAERLPGGGSGREGD